MKQDVRISNSRMRVSPLHSDPPAMRKPRCVVSNRINGSPPACKSPVREYRVSTTHPRLGPYGDRRRSQRVLLSVRVRITGTDASGVTFTEDTTTAVVNAHGGLVLLKTAVRQGQRLKIKNLNTDEEAQCIAIEANAGSVAAREIGVEFVAAAPRFWRVSFPPADWSSRSPEAKRFEKTGPVQEPAPPLITKK